MHRVSHSKTWMQTNLILQNFDIGPQNQNKMYPSLGSGSINEYLTCFVNLIRPVSLLVLRVPYYDDVVVLQGFVCDDAETETVIHLYSIRAYN